MDYKPFVEENDLKAIVTGEFDAESCVATFSRHFKNQPYLIRLFNAAVEKFGREKIVELLKTAKTHVKFMLFGCGLVEMKFSNYNFADLLCYLSISDRKRILETEDVDRSYVCNQLKFRFGKFCGADGDILSFPHWIVDFDKFYKMMCDGNWQLCAEYVEQFCEYDILEFSKIFKKMPIKFDYSAEKIVIPRYIHPAQFFAEMANFVEFIERGGKIESRILAPNMKTRILDRVGGDDENSLLGEVGRYYGGGKWNDPEFVKNFISAFKSGKNGYDRSLRSIVKNALYGFKNHYRLFGEIFALAKVVCDIEKIIKDIISNDQIEFYLHVMGVKKMRYPIMYYNSFTKYFRFLPHEERKRTMDDVRFTNATDCYWKIVKVNIDDAENYFKGRQDYDICTYEMVDIILKQSTREIMPDNKYY